MTTLENVKVWLETDTSASKYPEVKAVGTKKANVAVLFPGGGARACSCALGVVRALNLLELTDSARYWSMVSGGCWFGGPYLYSPLDDEALLGPYLEPSKCTLETLESTEAALVGASSSMVGKTTYKGILRWTVLSLAGWLGVDSFFLDFANCVVSRPKTEDVAGYVCWKNLVVDRYFKSTNLDGDMIMAASEEHKADLEKRFPLEGAKVITPRRKEMPMALINSTVQGAVRAGSQVNDETADFPPLVYSPLATGPYIKLTDVKYEYNDAESREYRMGGLVETLAFGGKLKGDHTQRTMETSRFWSLGDCCGASSMAYATAIKQLSDLGKLDLIAWFDRYQNLSNVQYVVTRLKGADTEPVSHQFDIGDGGNNGDNAGMIAALQRGVSSIFVYTPSSSFLDPDEKNPIEANIDKYVAAYFGSLSREDKKDEKSDILIYGWNLKALQVFRQSDFPDLVRQLQTSAKSGKGAIGSVDTVTVENPEYNIPAGLKVKVTVASQYLDKETSEWFKALPEETQKHLEKDDTDFPTYGLSQQTLDKTQVGLVANFAAWVLLENQKMVKAAFLK